MLYRLIKPIFLFFILLFLSCEKEKSQTPNLCRNRTTIVYMAADNNLSYFALQNVLDMQKGWDENYDGNLVVYIDRGDNAVPANPIVLDIKSSLMFDTTKIISPVVLTYPKSNSCDPTHMKRVLEDIIEKYPSESYGLILWSHGTAWFPKNTVLTRTIDPQSLSINGQSNLPLVKSWGLDKGYEMSIINLAYALPIKFEFIIFDACFMGGIEVIYELRDKAKYIMASPAEIISYGFPYKEIMPYLFPKQYDLAKVGDEFINFYNKQTGSLSTATISVVRTSNLESLKRETIKIFQTVKPINQVNISNFQQFEKSKKDRFFDLNQIFLSINTDSRLVSSYLSAVNETVIYKNSTSHLWEEPLDVFSGLSIFIPTQTNNYLKYYENLSSYKESGYSLWNHN